MQSGIRVIGPPGSGKSTLAKVLAGQTGMNFIEQDFFHNLAIAETGMPRYFPSDIPKEEVSRLKAERRRVAYPKMVEMLKNAIGKSEQPFVLEGAMTTCEYMNEIEELYDAIVFVDTPFDVRKQRIEKRNADDQEICARCIDKTMEYENGVSNPMNSRVCDEEWMQRKKQANGCQIIKLDGTQTTEKMIEELAQQYPAVLEMLQRSHKKAGGLDGTE